VGEVSLAVPETGCKFILKILVTGRPDGDILDSLAAYPNIQISASDILDDMRSLIHH
jgi:hypothetical protein